ncbi:SseB family protein [Streptomyces sp. NPDC020883]|uniref:SseB family protein n=1 Tax=Streptomyces sp. NPDC020883 TaxID=3365099 RepID=UPI0037920E92
MPLAGEVAAFHAGRPNPAALIGEFRRAVVILPIADDAFLAADLDGIRWLYAFSDEDSVSRFATGRGSDPAAEWQYATVSGARILDVLIPGIEGPAGVALDAGSAQGMLFPPVSGIVPDRVAVDAENGISTTSSSEV